MLQGLKMLGRRSELRIRAAISAGVSGDSIEKAVVTNKRPTLTGPEPPRQAPSNGQARSSARA
ncbi:MAG: hypothetical protein ACXWLG_03035, partial [Myxococcaceae bacterium]